VSLTLMMNLKCNYNALVVFMYKYVWVHKRAQTLNCQIILSTFYKFAHHMHHWPDRGKDGTKQIRQYILGTYGTCSGCGRRAADRDRLKAS
jgi:hypothetical protein